MSQIRMGGRQGRILAQHAKKIESHLTLTHREDQPLQLHHDVRITLPKPCQLQDE